MCVLAKVNQLKTADKDLHTARVFALEVTRVPTVLMQHRHCVLRFIPPAFIQVRLKSFSLFPFHPSPILSAPLLFFAPS